MSDEDREILDRGLGAEEFHIVYASEAIAHAVKHATDFNSFAYVHIKPTSA